MAQIAIGEAFEKAITTMTEYVEEIQKEVEGVFDNFYQVAVKENQYEPLYKIAQSLEKAYNEEVLSGIKEEIKKWGAGDGSYVQITERFKMGEAAKSKAQAQQEQIVEKIDSIGGPTKIAGAEPDFSNSQFDPENIKTKLGEILSQTKNLNEIVESKNNELETLIKDNESVRAIKSVGDTYGSSIATFVSQVTEKISDYLSGQMDSMMKGNEAAIDTAEKEVEKFKQAMDTNINKINEFLSDLFG